MIKSKKDFEAFLKKWEIKYDNVWDFHISKKLTVRDLYNLLKIRGKSEDEIWEEISLYVGWNNLKEAYENRNKK